MKGLAAETYERLCSDRENYLHRAREVASLTIPFLIPEEGSESSTNFPTPYQGTGAEGINNLSSKLILALFPPSSPFFRLVVDPATVRELGEEQGEDPDEIVQDVEEDVSVIEREIQAEIESRSLRPALFECFRHLLIAGNVLLRWDGPELRVFSLPQYVVKRDGSGKILWVITKEIVDRAGLPEGVGTDATADPHTKGVTLYTAAQYMPDGNYRLWQEVGSSVFDKDTVEAEDLPYIIPRMFALVGESYGRGLGEHYLGDLISLESLSRSIVLSAAAASHIVWLVNPNGFTKPSDLQKAVTGAFIPGNPADVQALRLDKNADLTVAASTLERIEKKLHRVFLLNTAAQRQGERVTATEINFLAQELEGALGGVYSLMNDQLQLPIVTRIMADMDRDGKLPDFPDGVLKAKVVTGLEGLGRNQQLERLRTFFGVAGEILGPQVLQQKIDADGTLSRIAADVGIDLKGITKSDEQQQQEAQAAQQAELQSQTAGPIAGAAAGEIAGSVASSIQQQQ